MITHIVLLQLKRDTTDEQVTAVLQRIQHLQDTIPGIAQIVTGKNLSVQHKGYEYGFLMQFTSEEALKEYAAHPAYQPIKAELQRISLGNIVCDLQQEPSLNDHLNGVLHTIKTQVQSLMKSWQGTRNSETAS